MHRWRSTTFLLILAIGSSIAETVQNVEQYTTIPEESAASNSELQADMGKLDYESALRPAVQKKRSIANIARLLLGGNVPPNHPLVKYPEPKAWNLANNIAASLTGASGLAAAASTQSEGWARQPGSALQNIQQLFETKAKIIPYTGQVATGLTGLASVKGDLIRQIHSISTQAIAQAAAEAAARALASAAAAHAVTNSIAHSVSPGAQTGIKGGWSSYQNTYLDPPGKTPGEQPGPPYHDSSAHINHYQPPPAAYNPYSLPNTTPPPTGPSYLSPAAFPTQPQLQQPYQNGYYTLYNTQPSTNSAQTPYTPAPPVAHARPTLSPNTLIATTPSGYSPSLSEPLIPRLRESKALPIIIYAPASNNTPLTSFRRAVPADIFGRNAAQPPSTSSLLSTISSLLAASTAAYNAAFTGNHPVQQQQPPAIFSNLLSSASSTFPATSSISRPTSPISASSILSPSISSPVYGNGYQQQSINALSQGGSNYGGITSSVGTGQLYHQPATNPYSSEARPASINSPSNPFNQHVTGHAGASYAQLRTNPYASQSVQSSSQFGSGAAGPAAATSNGGIGTSSYSTTGGVGYNPGAAGPGYTGNNVGSRPSTGHVSGWNTQHAGSSPGTASWPGSPNVYTPGYAGQAPGNINNSPGGFGGPAAAQFSLAAGSSLVQPTYSAPSSNPYQSPAANPYAQAQSALYSQQPSQLNSNPNGYQSANSNSNGVGGIRNPDISHRHDTQDLTQSATILGGDYDDDVDEEDGNHHSYQQMQRRNRPAPNNSYSSSRYPSSSKKRPTKQRPNNQSYNSGSKSSDHSRNNHHHHHKSQHGNNVKKPSGENGKRVIPTGSKKGSHFDSAVDVVDASLDDSFYEGEGHFDSDESSNESSNHNTDRDTNKNRWRTKNPSGQRPNSFHNHNSNGRWRGKTSHTKQAPSKNVVRDGGRPEGLRPQPGQSKGGSSKNHGNKEFSPNFDREQADQGKRHQQGQNGGGSKTEAAQLYRERNQPKKQQQPSSQFKSRDVYTTLPEHVFRVGERPDVFLRPGGKRKQGTSFRGRGALHSRVGETDGSGSSRGSSTPKKETLDTASTSHIYDEAFTREGSAEKNLEKSRSFSRTFTIKTPRGSEEEEFVSSSEAVDETARADIVNDQVASDSGFITSEEFDPEEREAFVDDVYADQNYHQSQRRQEENEAGTESESIEAVSEDNDDDDLVDKK